MTVWPVRARVTGLTSAALRELACGPTIALYPQLGFAEPRSATFPASIPHWFKANSSGGTWIVIPGRAGVQIPSQGPF